MQCALVPMQCCEACLKVTRLTVADIFQCKIMQDVWEAFRRHTLTAELGRLQSFSWPV